METLTDQVIKGSFWGGLANFLNRLGSLIFSIILARFMFPENFGLYSLTMSIALIFMTFADSGLNQTLIRYFSLYKNKKKAVAYFRYLFKIKFLLSFFVSLTLLVIAYPFSFIIFKKPQLFIPLILASLFILTSLFVSFFSSIFYAIRKVKYVGIKEIIFQITRLVLTVFVFISLASTYYVFGVITGLILTNIFILLLLLSWLNNFIPSIFKKTKEEVRKIQVLKFLGYITLSSISGIFFTYVDTIMLGFFVSFLYIGYYRVAFSLIFGVCGFFTYLGLVLLPIFTAIHKKRLKRAFNRVLRFTLIFSIPSAFGVLALGKYFVKLLYGDVYLPAMYPLSVLTFLLISWIPSTLIGTLFFSKGKPKHIAKITLAALFLNIFLNYLLISFLLRISELGAITGAAIATLFSRYFYLFSLSKTLRKKLNIRLEKTSFIKPIIAGLIMFFVLYILNTFFVKDMTLLIGIGEIFFGALIYFIVMFISKGVVKEDFVLMKKSLLRIFIGHHNITL